MLHSNSSHSLIVVVAGLSVVGVLGLMNVRLVVHWVLIAESVMRGHVVGSLMVVLVVVRYNSVILMIDRSSVSLVLQLDVRLLLVRIVRDVGVEVCGHLVVNGVVVDNAWLVVVLMLCHALDEVVRLLVVVFVMAILVVKVVIVTQIVMVVLAQVMVELALTVVSVISVVHVVSWNVDIMSQSSCVVRSDNIVSQGSSVVRSDNIVGQGSSVVGSDDGMFSDIVVVVVVNWGDYIVCIGSSVVRGSENIVGQGSRVVRSDDGMFSNIVVVVVVRNKVMISVTVLVSIVASSVVE